MPELSPFGRALAGGFAAAMNDYLDAIESHCGVIERTARSHGYDYLRLDSHASVGPAIAAMLGRRRIMSRGGSGS